MAKRGAAVQRSRSVLPLAGAAATRELLPPLLPPVKSGAAAAAAAAKRRSEIDRRLDSLIGQSGRLRDASRPNIVKVRTLIQT